MTKIMVGLVGEGRGWTSLLSQEGVPFRRAASGDDLRSCSAAVAGDDAVSSARDMLKSYLAGGGGLLCSATLFQALTGRNAAERRVRFIVPEPGSEFTGAGLVDPGGACRAAPDANTLRSADGVRTAYVGESGGGYVVALPFDAGAARLDTRQSVKSFYARRRRLPYERVATISHGGVRAIVARSLELLHHRRGLVYGHLWYYPDGAPTIALFRIDTDGAGGKELEDVESAAGSAGVPATWFLDMRTQDAHAEWYRSLHGHEIGLHCFEHRRYPDADTAYADLSKGLELLRDRGTVPHGCALPYGQWSGELSSVLSRLGILYSSEFAFDYDNLPSFPAVVTAGVPVLQVPVHPISIGSLRRQGFDADEMIEYFQAVIRRNVQARLPVALYHHPLNGHPGVLREALSFSKSLAPRTMLMGEFARWWKVRSAVESFIEVDDREVRTEIDGEHKGLTVRVSTPDGMETLVPLGVHSKRTDLPWAPVPGPPDLPRDIRRIRNYNPWIALQRAEDRLWALFRRDR